MKINPKYPPQKNLVKTNCSSMGKCHFLFKLEKKAQRIQEKKKFYKLPVQIEKYQFM
jgi:hypothetical protein